MLAENTMVQPTSYVNTKANIHPTAVIDHYCIIGNCTIGKNSKIHAFTTIKDGSIIGDNVIVRGYCHIGGCGFIFPRDVNGNLVQTPHISIAVLEDYVELSPYVNVDRGTTFETRIKRGTKIDHYSHIGHSCTIGEHCVIAATTVFSGESSLGDYSFVGVGVITKPKIKIGLNCLIGAGAVVTRDITDGWLAYGNPAKMIKINERGFLSKKGV